MGSGKVTCRLCSDTGLGLALAFHLLPCPLVSSSVTYLLPQGFSNVSRVCTRERKMFPVWTHYSNECYVNTCMHPLPYACSSLGAAFNPRRHVHKTRTESEKGHHKLQQLSAGCPAARVRRRVVAAVAAHRRDARGPKGSRCDVPAQRVWGGPCWGTSHSPISGPSPSVSPLGDGSPVPHAPSVNQQIIWCSTHAPHALPTHTSRLLYGD